MQVFPLAIFLAVTSLPTTAEEFRPTMQACLSSAIAPWINDRVIVVAVGRHGRITSGHDRSGTDALDRPWRRENGNRESSIISTDMNGPDVEFLRHHVAESVGPITEHFDVDVRGIGAAAHAAMSEHQRGGKLEYRHSFPKAVGAVHCAKIECDDSSETYPGQMSVAVLAADVQTSDRRHDRRSEDRSTDVAIRATCGGPGPRILVEPA